MTCQLHNIVDTQTLIKPVGYRGPANIEEGEEKAIIRMRAQGFLEALKALLAHALSEPCRSNGSDTTGEAFSASYKIITSPQHPKNCVHAVKPAFLGQICEYSEKMPLQLILVRLLLKLTLLLKS